MPTTNKTTKLTPEDIKKLASQTIQAQKTLSPAAMQKLAAIQQAKKQTEVAKLIKEKIDDIVKNSVTFKKAILKKYKDEVIGISVLPPRPNKAGEDKKETTFEDTKAEILLLLDIDEEDIRKLLKKKKSILDAAEKLLGSKLKGTIINSLSLKEVWDACMKGKYEILNIITAGVPVYDGGWLGSIRAVEMHKSQVIQKFEKYVVCYILAGSMVRGEADPTSDIDVFVVIDDTDVTRLTSAELKAKLSSIIIGMAGEATMRAGVKNPLNVQVYVLSRMWESLRDAHPVIFTFLREGIPLYDRGMFTPWKLLLQKGRIKPTPEAVKEYVKSGKRMIAGVKRKLKEIAMEDLFWAASIPAQGALMLEGKDVPVPNKTPDQFEAHFVKNKKLMSLADAKALRENITLRKGIEHGTIKDVSPEKVIKNLKLSENFLNKIEKVFDKLEKNKSKTEIKELWINAEDDIEAALRLVGISKTTSPLSDFKKYIVDKKLAPKRYYELLKQIKEFAKKCNISRVKIERLSFEQEQLAKDVFDKIRAKKGVDLSRYRISVKYGNKIASVWILENKAYVINDVSDSNTSIISYALDKKGKLSKAKPCDLKSIDGAVRKFAGKPREISDNLMASLKKVLGKDANIVVGA